MCGAFAQGNEFNKIKDVFNIQKPDGDFEPSWNIRPGQQVWGFENSEPHKLQLFHWQLKPSWFAADYKPLINIRIETIIAKPAFRNLYLSGRCCFPASGFYEWKKQKKDSQPWLFRTINDEPFALCGIFLTNNKLRKHFAIITLPANEAVKPVHHRMPLMMNPDKSFDWLEKLPSLNNISDLTLKPEFLKSHRVSAQVNSVTNNFPSLSEPYETGQLSLFG